MATVDTPRPTTDQAAPLVGEPTSTQLDDDASSGPATPLDRGTQIAAQAARRYHGQQAVRAARPR